MYQLFSNIRWWLVRILGGSPPHDCKAELWLTFSEPQSRAVQRACRKVARDPSFAAYEASNLGRNIFRDEACEWTKLYLKDAGVPFRDSEIHLACELYYHLFMRTS